MLYLTDEATVQNLESYVNHGGCLYGTYMMGTVDGNDLCYLGGIPAGPLKEVFGVTAEEIDTLYPVERQHAQMDGNVHELVDYCETVRLIGAEALAVYTDGYYQGTPAVTVNRYGRGQAIYQACRDCGSLKGRVLDRLLREMDIHSLLAEETLPHGVTAHSRTDGVHTYLFVENYSATGAAAVKPQGKHEDLLNGSLTDVCKLPPYGFGVFKRERTR